MVCKRLEAFVDRANKADADFIIQLGDLCYPTEENRILLRALDRFAKPKYHLLGNHDMLNWLGMDRDYYSFICKDVHFIKLDTNYIKHGDKVIPCSHRNNKIMKGEYPYLPEEQVAWLEKEIAESVYPIVIFSHHSLENSFRNRGIANRNTVQDIIARETQKGKDILACMNGHDHADSVEKVDSILYITVNSISYKWFGFQSYPFSEEIQANYPDLPDIILHEQPLSSLIVIHDNNDIEIQGMEGGYQDHFSPSALGIHAWDGRAVSASIQSRRLIYS
ncbi:metallophosphoesterase family protein [Paenibacillus aquistagni]|uniref:metallophosphoesterase family protein n=1 Tax=Paenibacillus aquistagni TaxID=1852522 RepID=UPI00145A8D6C|nr:metallophosphoesterase [Paenibacillus aquistagni]NMM54102.1 metallophosphoesterase [Paenibacillus aquistagni]